MSIEMLKGLTLSKVEVREGDGEIIFWTKCGRSFQMLHYQGCCESVYLEDTVGDLQDLISSPILIAEERSEEMSPDEAEGESGTWTFYELRTVKASVTLRWGGYSNGYYSEDVDFEEVL